MVVTKHPIGVLFVGLSLVGHGVRLFRAGISQQHPGRFLNKVASLTSGVWGAESHSNTGNVDFLKLTLYQIGIRYTSSPMLA